MEVQIDNYAPIMIPTLCRFEHFKRCIESLARCTGAEYTELFIGLDYPAKEVHWDGYLRINEYVDTISGFKSVNIFRREVNYGVLKNILALKEEITKKYDRHISTEDDNEFSPNFLEYMNKGLELYKDNPKVVAICGYSYPFEFCENINGYTFNAYPIQSFSAWGTGYWSEKRKIISTFINADSAYNLIHSWSKILKLFKKKQHITVHRLLFRHEIAYGDLMWRAYCALNDVYCIFPLVSKVRNLGFDGSGLNCNTDSIYMEQAIDMFDSFDFDNFEIKPYKPITRIHKKLFADRWIIRRLCEIEYVMYRLFGVSFTQIGNKLKKSDQ